MMRMLAAVVALAGAAAPAEAATIFRCALNNGRQVSVDVAGGRYTYRYGRTGAAPELILGGDARGGTVRVLVARHSGTLYKLRFVSGAQSYIVYSMDGNPQTGARAVAGLIVTRGMRKIGDRSCTRFAGFGATDFTGLPQDGGQWSAMAL